MNTKKYHRPVTPFTVTWQASSRSCGRPTLPLEKVWYVRQRSSRMSVRIGGVTVCHVMIYCFIFVLQQKKDTVYYTSLFNDRVLHEMLSPMGCRVTNELMEHYLDGVLPRASHLDYDNSTLNGLHVFASSMQALYQHMLKCVSVSGSITPRYDT